ncbi:MAG: hypothetical protein HRT68_13520, partial [Flavobacteriaceae bacterium]|nr:hypothetical protein [Flavobacteriaceae bacterium]
IQNDFPETYGIGQTGLAARATIERKAQAKQLKSYLIFFDKILATYFKHLSKVSELLSINGRLTKTYFTQAIKDIEGFEDLVDAAYDTNNDEVLTELLLEQFDNNIERRNLILDHLLSRFAERFGDYTFLMKALYGSATDEIVLSNKEAFLSDYIAISSERGCGFNYFMQGEHVNPANDAENLWDTDNISGFQKRVSRLLGIKNYNRRTLSSSFVEVYSLINSDSETVFRWRIRDEEDNIILSATEEYKTVSLASDELYLSVLQIVQTTIKEIENAYEQGFVEDQNIGNLQLGISPTGKYSFSVINKGEPPTSTDHIIAKQYKYYDTAFEVKEAMIAIINFMKFKFTEEGIFLVEHILLRPFPEQDPMTPFMPICTDNCEDDCGIDPYSYRVSIVLPGYTYRFSNPDFRNYAETIIREELPAHILPKICWVGYREGTLENMKEQQLQQFEDQRAAGITDLDNQIMDVQNSSLPQAEKDALIAALEAQKVALNQSIDNQIADFLDSIVDQNNDLVDFENAYKDYLVAKTCLENEQPEEIEELLSAMAKLNTIYPVGRLLDCNDESDELEGRIILGQTNIGTL